MTTMMIKGVRFTVTDTTAAEIKRDLDAYETERREFERDRDDLANAEAIARETGDWSYYSDVYKDIYGIRPRWKWS